jgi:endoglucanase
MMMRVYASLIFLAAPVVALGCLKTNDGADNTGGDMTGGSGGSFSAGTGGSASTGGAGGGSSTGGGSSAAGAGGGADAAVACGTAPAGLKAAPCGYYVDGNKVLSVNDGSAHLFHGVARPSLEWASSGDHISAADADLMKAWKVNTVRFSLNQGFWLPGTSDYAPNYQAGIAQYVSLYERRGFDIILDLHWNSLPPAGSPTSVTGQQNGPDARSVTFWQQVAAAYKNDGHVLFELYNEPHDLSDDQWFSGMSGLYNAVRSAGADNLVLIGGLDWAFDLTVMSRRPIAGYNIMLASHPYQDKQDFAGKVDSLAGQYPIILTEFGDRSGSCSTQTSTTTISHANQMGYSWTAWAWYPQTGSAACTFPSLISDWASTPTAEGTVAKNALLGY